MGNYFGKESGNVIDILVRNYCAENIRTKTMTEEGPIGASVILNTSGGSITSANAQTSAGVQLDLNAGIAANDLAVARESLQVQNHRFIRAKARFGKFVYNMINFLVVFTGVGKHGYTYELFTPSGSRTSQLQLTDKPEKLVEDIVNLADGLLTEEQCKQLADVVPHFAKQCVKLEFMTNDKYAHPKQVRINDDSVQFVAADGDIRGDLTVPRDNVGHIYEISRVIFGDELGNNIMDVLRAEIFNSAAEESAYEEWALPILERMDLATYRQFQFWNENEPRAAYFPKGAAKLISAAKQLRAFCEKKAEQAAAAIATTVETTTDTETAVTADTTAETPTTVDTETTADTETPVTADVTTAGTAASEPMVKKFSLTESKMLVLKRLAEIAGDN